MFNRCSVRTYQGKILAVTVQLKVCMNLPVDEFFATNSLTKMSVAKLPNGALHRKTKNQHQIHFFIVPYLYHISVTTPTVIIMAIISSHSLHARKTEGI